MPKVALVKCKNYSSVKSSIKKSLDLIGGLNKFIKKGDKVLLKPNMSDPLPAEKAAVTHPQFIKAAIELVKEITPYVWVGDQAASTIVGSTEQTLEASGIKKIIKETNAQFRDLQVEGFVKKSIHKHKVLKEINFAKAIFESDIVINLPKLKSHGLMYITGAIKNCFGCTHSKERQRLHKKFSNRNDFSQGLVDVFCGIRPKLTIMDAVIAMQGDGGPSYGKPINLGYVLASKDAVALDAVAAKLTGHNPLSIPTTRAAHQRGIGQGDLSKIDVKGAHLKSLRFKQHTAYRERYSNKSSPYPSISQGKCKKCAACFHNCPARAISKIKGNFQIDRKKCIACYCCVENCIYGAIDLTERRFANIRLGLECNENCLFCTVSKDNEPPLDTKEAKKDIGRLFGKGITDVTLTGGEPTIRKDLPDLIRFSKHLGISSIQVQTNGVRLSDKSYLLELKKAGLDSVLIAFHSHKKKTYNKLTRSTFYETAVQGIKNCTKCGVNAIISHVINKENYKDTTRFIKFIHSISKNIPFYFSFVRPNGNALDNKWIVPKLTEIEPYLYKTMNYCKSRHIWFLVEGVPLCYMQGFEKHCAETERMSKPPQEYLGGGNSRHIDVHDFIHSNLKRKSGVCKVCFLNNVCAGLWKEYAELHGTDELFPIFKNFWGHKWT